MKKTFISVSLLALGLNLLATQGLAQANTAKNKNSSSHGQPKNTHAEYANEQKTKREDPKSELQAVYKLVLQKESAGELHTKIPVGTNEKIQETLAASVSYPDFIKKLTEAKFHDEIIAEFKQAYYEKDLAPSK